MKHEQAWYVAQVLSGTEQDVVEKIKAAGHEALAPVEVIPERRHGVWRDIRRLVFPGYVFLRVPMSPRMYYYIKQLRGVIRLLGVSSPEPVPDDEMQVVHTFANGGRDFGLSKAVKDGQTVRITEGPLLGLIGKVVSVDARQRRAAVEIDLMGQTHRVYAGIEVIKSTDK